MEVHQVLPALSYGDAVSNDAIEIRNFLMEHGYSSRIYAKYIHPKVSKFAFELTEYTGNSQNVVLYHFSLAGGDVTEFVKHLPDKKVLIYHNITPPEFFDRYDEELQFRCARGLDELKSLCGYFKLAIGDSEYNRSCLEKLGYAKTAVVPILIDVGSREKDANLACVKRSYENDTVNILFVGRIVPNKKHEDVIKSFYYYHRYINPNSRLYLVGNKQIPGYMSSLVDLINTLGLSEDVIFTGMVSEDELLHYYQISHVFLCMSEHEGFCVPLLEAMHFGIPVIAYNSTGIPYTLGDAGILVARKNFIEIAELMNIVIEDAAIRNRIVVKQAERIDNFDKMASGERLIDIIESLNERPNRHDPRKDGMGLEMLNPLVSVVVCTYNRDRYLERCLVSLKKQLYQNYEIIVVNGPSNDETDSILRRYPDIQVIRQKSLNGLSYARNLGINASKGEIVAFIDDDAVADKKWLVNLVSGYTDDSVGGVGGLVYGPQKTHLQFDNGTIDKCGIPVAIRPESTGLRKGEFQIFMGTNCSFKRDVLHDVGGFDPYFRYYHDESDLCVRIAMSGHQIVYRRDAFVVHDMVEGHNRKSPYDLNWSEILKNVIYFTMKNFPGELLSYTARPVYSTLWWLLFFQYHLVNRRISLRQLIHIYHQVFAGVIRGYRDGLCLKSGTGSFMGVNNVRGVDNDGSPTNPPEEKFSSANRRDESHRFLRIALVSQEYAKDCHGGICRYTYDLAHGLADLGNEVHVISKSESREEYDYRDGNVFVHKVTPQSIDFLNLSFLMPVSKKNLSYSYAVCQKLLDLVHSDGIQIVESPLWDAEGFVFSLVKPVPLVVRIETPLCKVAEIQEWKITKDLKFAHWMEGETVRRADKVIAISKAIGTLICDYHTVLEDKIEVSPLGIDLPDNYPSLIDTERDTLDVLFVGRLEKRKGIETLFEAIPVVIDRVPNARFTLVGGDTHVSPLGGSYKKYLLKSLNKKYHPYLHFAGFVSDAELMEYYRNCDIFVAPSLYESFGLIYLEAMGWGKPVIGCDVGGVPEVIVNGETGIIVPSGDAKALAEAISLLLVNREKRRTMGQMAFQWVKNNYTKDIMIKNSLNLYFNLRG